MTSVFLRFPNGKAKALTLSYDDGVEQDIRLLNIMNRHGLKGTFNLNSGLYAPEGTVYPADRIHRRMTMSKSTEVYLNSGHEVAVHTLTHPYLDRLPSDRVVYEVMKDRENLEKQFGVIVKGMAYPYGNTSDQAVEAIKICGIVYARTTVSTNTFDIPTDWLRMPTTCYHRSPALRKLTTTFLKECADNRPYLFSLWGHSYDFDTNDSWHDIEVFAEQVGNRDDIWYATNMEIYEYVQDYNRLNFSVDGTLVQNPTGRTIWLFVNGKTLSVDPGKMIRIE
jgi:peptidoglycan/xylan/chitin deacetylase (PgdA/CDA1 family)